MELSMPPESPPAAGGGALPRNEHLLRRIDAAIESVRRICSDLRPSLLDNMGLAAAIEWLAQDVQERTHIRCEAMLEGLPSELEPERATALFRIVQEAVTNVIRHAGASNVIIRQRTRGDEIVIEVSDDGRGIKPKEHSGEHAYGIAGMHERAKALGGSVRVSGGPKGTRVLVHMPGSSRGGEA
jgi:signal transduction histidine kinase